MINSPTGFMSVLGLPTTADERAVRKAYARQLKQIDQAHDLEGFQRLRQAYEMALEYTRSRRQENSQGPEPADIDHTDPGAAGSGHESFEGFQQADDVARPSENRPIDQSAHGSMPELPAHDAQATTGSEESVRFDSDQLGRVAEEAFQAFLQTRPPLPLFWRVDAAKAALSRALDEPCLINFHSKMVFEGCLLQYLLGGWQPGHEELLTTASECFDWETDPQRLARFGWAGAAMEHVLTERAAFASLPSKWQEQERKLIELLRKGNPKPSTRFLAAKIGPLRKLASEFPNWLGVVAPVKTLAGWEQLADAKLAGMSPDVAAEPSSRKTLAQVAFLLIFTPLFFGALLVMRDCTGQGYGTVPRQSGFEPASRGSMRTQPRLMECRAMLEASISAEKVAAEIEGRSPDLSRPGSEKRPRNGAPDQQVSELPDLTENLTAAEKDFAKEMADAGRRVLITPVGGQMPAIFLIDGRPCALRPAPIDHTPAP